MNTKCGCFSPQSYIFTHGERTSADHAGASQNGPATKHLLHIYSSVIYAPISPCFSMLQLLFAFPDCVSFTPPLSVRLSSTASGSDGLFGPPLEMAFKSKSFDSQEQLREQNTFGASECKKNRFPFMNLHPFL